MGFGHLRRCLILAGILSECRPLFLLDPGDCWSREQVESQGFEWCAVSLESVWTQAPEPDAIFIDTRISQGLDAFIAAARARNIPVISMHDLGLNPLPSDVVIDGSILPDFQPSPYAVGESFRGTDFMVLDPDFAALHQRSKTIRKEIQSIVVSLGGGDSRKYFMRVLEGVRQWGRDVEVIGFRGFVDWGQGQWNSENLHPVRFRWETGPASHFLGDADLAITAGGLSAYEACCAGTPLLALSYDALQQATLKALASAGGCINLGSGDDLDPACLAGLFAGAETGWDARRKLSQAGRTIADGQGAGRVARIIRQRMQRCRTACNSGTPV